MMGIPVNIRDKKIEELRSTILNNVSQFLVKERQDLITQQNYRDYQVNEINTILKDLSLEAYKPDTSKTLCGQNKALNLKLKELQNIKTERLESLERLESNLKKTYQSLGLDYVRTTLFTSIPSESELITMRTHLASQNKVLEERKKRFESTKGMLSNYLRGLEYVPEDENEKMILTSPSCAVVYSQSTLNLLSNFHTKIIDLFNSAKEEIESLKTRLSKLFERLDIETKVRQAFWNSLTGSLPQLREKLLTEINRYELLKKSCMEKIIKNIRKEIEALQESCMVEKFDDALTESNDFTEELLVEHEKEFSNLSKFHQVYEDVLNKLREWEKGLGELAHLEKKLLDPNRFNNRGGSLLQNERERKMWSRKLPRLEKDIKQLISIKETKELIPFDTYGLNIDEFFKLNWDHFKDSKTDLGKLASSKKSAPLFGGVNSSKKSCATLSSQKKSRMALSPRINLLNRRPAVHHIPTSSRRLFNENTGMPRSTSAIPLEEEFGVSYVYIYKLSKITHSVFSIETSKWRSSLYTHERSTHFYDEEPSFIQVYD